ncbi:rhodanese-like domain-containing protein [Pseudaeromonas paramecii]|uniref:Rhodanese-like domain-containing protein n=1 Tax=Pseudaeromonas paramecii TaxID=2138166 RepID=A0ABP8QLA5_9GAMM
MQEYIDFIVRNPLLAAAWLGLLVALFYTTIKAKFSPVKAVNSQGATLLINRQQAVVVDVRNQDEYAKGHIAGSHHVPVSQIDGNNLTLIEKFKENPIIVVCESGMRAGPAAAKLSKAGFKQVFLLRGGLADWRSENMPLTKKR